MLAWGLGFLCGLAGRLLLARWSIAAELKKWRRATRLLNRNEEIINKLNRNEEIINNLHRERKYLLTKINQIDRKREGDNV